MNRKFILKMFVFVVILYFLDLGIGKILKSTHELIFTEKMMHDFYHESNNIDLAFMGSSHVYRTFDPYFFYEALGVNAFNLGSPFQNPTITYYLLQELIRLNHKPKVIVLETYWPILCGFDTNYNSASYVFHYMKFSPNKVKLFWHAFEFPSSLRLFSRSFHYRRFFKNFFHKKNPRDNWKCDYRGKGFIPCDKIATSDDLLLDDLSTQKQVFNDYRIEYFEKTIRLAQSHGIEVVAVMTPVHPQILAKIRNYSEIHQRIHSICQRNGINFFDFNQSPSKSLIIQREDFMDHNHLNMKGAEKINLLMAPLLAEKLQTIPDSTD